MNARRLALAPILALAACAGTAPEDDVVVFGAASLQDVLREAARAGARTRFVINAAASNALARQIIAAPSAADVFVSADTRSMDEVERAGLLAEGTRTAIATNTLVAVASRASRADVRSLDDLASARYRALALADPQAVPAGRYARAALERASHPSGSLWEAVRDRVVPTADVRAAMALAESDPEFVAIVYASDARRSSRVQILFPIPAGRSDAIVCVAAALRHARHPDGARTFLAFLTGPEGQAILGKHGFGPAPGNLP